MVFFLRNALNTALGDPLETNKPADEVHPGPADTQGPTGKPSMVSARSMRQMSMMLAGGSFVLLSSYITKRAITRRVLAARPRFYQPNNQPAKVNGGAEAFEALNLATLNVFSWAILLGGGTLWALDLSSLEEMRAAARRTMSLGSGPTKDADEEVEEWLASVLARKETKALLRKVGATIPDDFAETQQSQAKTDKEGPH